MSVEKANTILLGNCKERLLELPENSIDSIITDPPYGLVSIVKRFGGKNSRNTPTMETKEGGVFARTSKGFMGKEWDGSGIEYDVEMWKECLRVLKPGGHLLAFGGTRTYHRMAVAIEDAGFEVRDMIEWVYGSGFPKSLNIGKSVNQLETNEWSKIGKSLDNIDHKSIMEIWKSNSNNVKIVETQSLKNQIIAGQDTPSENFVVLNVAHNNNQENSNLLVNFAEQNLNEAQVINTKTNTALLNVEAEIRQLQNNVRSAEQQSQNQNLKSWSIFTAQCDVKEWLNENTEVNHKVDEALKTLRGNKKYSNEEIINVLCVALTDILKLTILNQSKTFQNLDTKSKMDCVSAINVIITEYTAENLISNTVAILKSKAVDKLQGNERRFVSKNPANRPYNLTKGETSTGWQSPPRPDKDKGTSQWEGWGTALKPAHEPICMARKPLAEKTVAENVLKWKTGGLNIDGSRVEGKLEGDPNRFAKTDGGSFNKFSYAEPIVRNEGRFPANIIHDNSEEVRECFPQTVSKYGKSTGVDINPDNCSNMKIGLDGAGIAERTNRFTGDSGNASRFFKSIIYQAKASKSERNRGLDSTLTVKYNSGICKEENMVAVELLRKVTYDTEIVSFNIDESGENITVQCHRDSLSTILTTTNKTIELRTLNSLQHFITNGFIQGANSEVKIGINPAENVESLSKYLHTITKGNQESARGVSNAVLQMLQKIKDVENWKPATNFHATVKPIALMEYLIKMVTPKGGIVLDPFAGSGSTLVAAKQSGFKYIGIEMEEQYVEIIHSRLNAVECQPTI